MDINNYLIEQEGQDWSELLGPWFWILPESFHLWMVNKLGDLILILEDDRVYFLDIAAGLLEQIAENQKDFVAKINQDDNADQWLAISLVEDCLAAGMQLDEGQCFGYQLAPVMGGEFDVSNLEPTDLLLYYNMQGQIHEQIKDVPEGTAVNIEIRPPRRSRQDDEE